MPSDFDIFSPLDLDQAVVHPVGGERAAERRRPGPARSRGAGTRGRGRRRGGRSRRRAGRATSRRTRCASPAGPRPTATATTARPAWPASTARSRAATRLSSPSTSIAARRPAATRATGGRAGRSPSTVLDREVHAVGGLVGVAARRRARRSARPSRSTYAVACGSSVGRLTPIASIASHQTASQSAAISSVEPRPRVGAVDDVVVDVGDVRDVADLEARPLEVAAQHVEHEREAAVAEVRRAVDGRPAHVHRHLARLARRELADRRPRRCRRGGARPKR